MDMVPPSRIAARLRKIAGSVAQDASLSKVLQGLRRILVALEEGPVQEKVVLQGPFKLADKSDLVEWNVHEGVVGGLPVESDEFMQLALEGMKDDPDFEMRKEDLEGGDHTFHVEVNWYWSPSEPDVGWAGGSEIDGWVLVDLDGIVLTERDAQAVKGHIEEAVQGHESDWAEEAEKYKAEEGFDPPDDYGH